MTADMGFLGRISEYKSLSGEQCGVYNIICLFSVCYMWLGFT
jgi:hypothetical protein